MEIEKIIEIIQKEIISMEEYKKLPLVLKGYYQKSIFKHYYSINRWGYGERIDTYSWYLTATK